MTLGGTINSNGTILVNGSNSLIIGGSASGTGTINQAAIGGQVSIAGADTMSGVIFVNGGTLNINAGGSITGSSLQLNSGNVVINGATADSTLNATTLSGGASKISGAFGGANTLNLSAITRPIGAVLDVSVSAGNVSTSTANSNFTSGQQTILGGYATVNGNTWAVSGSGASAGNITGLSTFDTNFTAGTDVDMTPDGGTQPTATGTVNSIRFNNAGTYTIATGGNVTVATGGILETANVGANTVTISGNTLLSGNGKDLIVIQNNPAAAMTISSAIGAAGQAFTKAGIGSLIVAASNPFDQGLFIDAGTVGIHAMTINSVASG